MFKSRQIRFGGRGVSAGTVDNSDLVNMAQGTVKGRAATAGTGPPQDLTGAQQGQNIRFDTEVADATSSGTVTDYAGILSTTTSIRFNPPSALTINSIVASAGQEVLLRRGGASSQTVTLVHEDAASTAANRIQCPGNVSVVLNETQGGVLLRYHDSRWRVYMLSVPSGYITPARLAVVTSNIAAIFAVHVTCASGGASGTADDVTIWNANAPFALRILDAQLRVSTAVGGSNAALRTASGGGGSVVMPDPSTATQTFSTAAAGVLEDLATATATVAANGSLFLRRSDRSVVGELTLTCIKT